MNTLYPLLFTPIYKKRIWGGCYIKNFLHRETPENITNIGEAWDISDREDDNSQVANGHLKGLSIKDLRKKFKDELLGSNWDYNNPLPVLVKIIDADKDLSLQLHPLEGTADSKTEFWYVLSAEDSKIMLGTKPNVDNNELLENIGETDFLMNKALNIYNAKVNDLYYVPSGCLHAIGEKNLILEIQENSDTTYRVSDWDRLDENNNKRELHIEKAKENLSTESEFQKINVNLEEKNKVLLSTNRFIIEQFTLNSNKSTNLQTSKETFKTLSIINGKAEVSYSNETLALKKGDNLLIPANCKFIIKGLDADCSFLITTPIKKI